MTGSFTDNAGSFWESVSSDPNLIIGTHDRVQISLFEIYEPINGAIFDLYRASENPFGPIASISGNTVPADTRFFGTLAEGTYSARFQGRQSYIERGEDDLSLIINEGMAVPTVLGNSNILAPGWDGIHLRGIFIHAGNYARESLTTMIISERVTHRFR